MAVDKSDQTFVISDEKIDVSHYNLRGRYEIDELLQKRIDNQSLIIEGETKHDKRSKSIVQTNQQTELLVKFPPIPKSNRYQTSMNQSPSGDSISFDHQAKPHAAMVPSIKIKRNAPRSKIKDTS